MRKLFRPLAVLVILGASFMSNLSQISAQSNALAITPRKDYVLEPGDSVTDTLSVTNRNSTETLTLSLTVVDFEAQDESGTPSLLDPGAQKTPWSIRDFITMPEQVVVAPSATVRVPISIEVPDGVGAGSYYSAIEYTSVNEVQDNSVNIAAAGVSLLFVKVPGQATQLLTFEQFGAFVPDENGTGGSFSGIFFGERPKMMAYRLKNQGNIAEQPNASITIYNSSGDTVYTITDANPKDQLALRGQTRRFDACIVPENVEQTSEDGQEFNAIVCGDTNFKPGRYTAELSVLYGENNTETREITAKATFWYLPWWFIGTVIAGLAIVAGVVLYFVRRVKSIRSRKTRRR